MKKPSQALFGYSFSPIYKPGPFARTILADYAPALELKTWNIYQRRPRQGLWISIMLNASDVPRIIRGKASRLLRSEFKNALAAQGFDAMGINEETKQHLSGSIEFFPSDWNGIIKQRQTLETYMRDISKWLITYHKQQLDVTVKQPYWNYHERGDSRWGKDSTATRGFGASPFIKGSKGAPISSRSRSGSS